MGINKIGIYDSAFRNLDKGKVSNRTDLIVNANYEHVRLFMLVPLRGKRKWGPHPRNKSFVPYRGFFESKFEEQPCHF